MSVTFQALARHYYREMKEISFRNDILPLKDKLYRLALRITFDTAEAEDIVQETLIRVWDKRDEWSQLNSIEAYCLTICRHLSLDRSEKKEAQHVALDESLHSRPDTSTPYDSLTAREGLGLLQKLLKELPQTQQDIVQLREIEGKSYKEIAANLQPGNNVLPTMNDDLEAHQMTLFDTVREDDIIKELQEIDLGTMTPIEGLNYLYKLQNQLKNRWQ